MMCEAETWGLTLEAKCVMSQYINGLVMDLISPCAESHEDLSKGAVLWLFSIRFGSLQLHENT